MSCYIYHFDLKIAYNFHPSAYEDAAAAVVGGGGAAEIQHHSFFEYNDRYSNSKNIYSSSKTSLYNPLNSSYQSTINSSYNESFHQYSYNEFKHDFDNNNYYSNKDSSKIAAHSTLYLPPLQYDRLSRNHNNIYEPSIMQLNIDNYDDHPFRKNQQHQRQQQFSAF